MQSSRRVTWTARSKFMTLKDGTAFSSQYSQWSYCDDPGGSVANDLWITFPRLRTFTSGFLRLDSSGDTALGHVLKAAKVNFKQSFIFHSFTSNDTPSDVEETLVRSIIQSMRGEITTLRLEIDNYSSHPQSVTTLEDRKATIIRNITAHESIISPLCRLPPELLQVIFLQTHRDPQTTSMLPWSLIQVC